MGIRVQREILGQIVWEDSAQSATSAVDMQRRIQTGCDDGCGWAGDRFLMLRAVPAKHERRFGRWAVIQSDPNGDYYVIHKATEVDHRIIVALQDARKNWENIDATMRALDAHDAAVEKQADDKAGEIYGDMAQRMGSHMRKTGQL